MTKVRCEGCGRTGNEETWEQDIRAAHPGALTCCPDRNLKPVSLTVWIVMDTWEDSIAGVFKSEEAARKWATEDYGSSNGWSVVEWEVQG